MNGLNPIRILLVEDNPGDVRLTREALKETKLHLELAVAEDGEQAIDYLHGQGVLPDLVLLDLNLPRKDGREVLAEMKADPRLRRIPVVVLTMSKAEEDILKAYDLHANCFISKPIDLDAFLAVVKSIEDFWLTIVRLPPKG